MRNDGGADRRESLFHREGPIHAKAVVINNIRKMLSCVCRK